MEAQRRQRHRIPTQRFPAPPAYAQSGQRKHARLGPPQPAQMRSAAQIQAQLMSHRPHVATGADRHRELGLGPVERNNLKADNTTVTALSSPACPRGQAYTPACRRSSWPEKGGGNCSISPWKRAAAARTWARVSTGTQIPPLRLALGIIGICRKAEADRPRHYDFSDVEKYCASRVNLPSSSGSTPVAMGSSVPRLPDRLLARNPAQPVHHIVAGHAARLVDYKLAHSPHYCSRRVPTVTARHSPSAAPTDRNSGASPFWRKKPNMPRSRGRVLLFFDPRIIMHRCALRPPPPRLRVHDL